MMVLEKRPILYRKYYSSLPGARTDHTRMKQASALLGLECKTYRSLTIIADWGTNGTGVYLRPFPLVSQLIYGLLASPERTPWPDF